MSLIQEHGVRGRRPAAMRVQKPRRLRTAAEQEADIALLAQRYDAGVGLFDAAPLQGSDADDWLRLQFGLAETTQEELEPEMELEQAA